MQTSVAVPERPQPSEEAQQALWVILFTVVGLLLGWMLMTCIQGRSSTFSAVDGKVSLRYPVSWIAGKTEDGLVLNASAPVAAGAIRPALKVYVRSLPQGQKLVDAATVWTLGRMSELRDFRDLGSEATTIGGQPAIAVNYGYISDLPASLGPASLPVVARGHDVVVLQGNQYVVFSTVSDASQGGSDSAFAAILKSVKLAGK